MQGEGQDHHGVPSKGKDQRGCLFRLWEGLTKGTCQEHPSGSWGILFYFLIPARATLQG